MKDEVREAIIGSIEKWKTIKCNNGVDDGPYNCPLCKKFHHGTYDTFCSLCPVFSVSKEKFCDNTPFELWAKIFEDTDEEYILKNALVLDKNAEKVVDDEISFLELVLKEYDASHK